MAENKDLKPDMFRGASVAPSTEEPMMPPMPEPKDIPNHDYGRQEVEPVKEGDVENLIADLREVNQKQQPEPVEEPTLLDEDETFPESIVEGSVSRVVTDMHATVLPDDADVDFNMSSVTKDEYAMFDANYVNFLEKHDIDPDDMDGSEFGLQDGDGKAIAFASAVELFYNSPHIEIKDRARRSAILIDAPYKNTKPSGNIMFQFTSMLGIGEPVKIQLPTSGFTLLIKPATKPQLYKFLTALANKEEKAGFTIAGASEQSFEELNVAKNAIALLNDVLIYATLDAEDPIKFILYDDLPLIFLGILKSLYPGGLNIAIPCVGAGQAEHGEDEEGQTLRPKCNSITNFNVGSQELIWSQDDKITSTGKELVSRGTANSITVKEVQDYQLSLPSVVKSFEVDGNEFKFMFGPKLLIQWFKDGDATLGFINAQIMESFGNNNNMKSWLADSYLRLRSNCIAFSGQGLEPKPEDFIPTLDLMFRNNIAVENFLTGMDEYSSNATYRIGIATHTCGNPNCKATNGETVDKILPINPLSFLVLGVKGKR